jgi:serine/threonine protein kinase
LQCVMKEFQFFGIPSRDRDAKRDIIQREIEILKRLSHPNIIQYLSSISSYNSIKLFLTRYESTLRKEVQNRVIDEELFSAIEICHVMRQVANGLEYLHKNGITHRDLKSANLFVNYNARGAMDTVVIADFDTAKTDLLGLKSFCGTKNYIAPEIAQLVMQSDEFSVTRVYTFKVDIWSFGMVLYEMLVLCIPYKGISEEEILSYISKGFRPSIPTDLPHLHNTDYKELISLYEYCATADATQRPTTSELIEAFASFTSFTSFTTYLY